MKKRCSCFFFFLTLVILLFSFFSLPAFASETIFEDYIVEESSATIDGESYTAYEYSDYAGVRLSSNKYGSIILESEGSSTVKGPYTFSLTEILEEDNIVSFKITVEKEEADVSMSREVSNSTVHLDQQVEVIVEISNDGTDTVTVKYAEDLPSEVHLIGVPEITKGTTTQSQKSTVADIYWNGALYQGESVTIVYTVEIDKYPSTGSTLHFDDVTFTYKDDSGEYSGTVDTLVLSLTDPLQIGFTLETDEDVITVGTEVEYTLTLANSMDNTVTVSSFLLELPGTVTISHIDTQLEESDDGYTWSGTLNPFEDISFTFIVIPISGGTHSFDAGATYAYGSAESAETSASTSFSIEVSDVVPEIKLSSESFDGGEPIIIYYYVNNSDKDVSYSNVEMTITSDPELFAPVHYVASLPKNTKTLIKKQNFTAPYTDTEIEYEITLEGDLGGGATFDEDATVTINPSSFTVPYALAYAIDGVDEENTNVTLTITLLTDLAEKPTKLAVVHTAEEYKKTISLGTENINSLFSTKTYSKSWSIPTVSYSGDSVDLDVQLQYTTSAGVYYKSLTETIPVFEEEVEEVVEEGNETISGNETLEAEETTEANETETNVTEDVEEEEEVVITGQKEETSKKLVWFFVILASIVLLVFSLRYFFAKKHKESAIKRTIASISSKEPGKEEKKESIFARAKEIIIQDVPSPEEGYDKLEGYIKTALGQGKAHEEIKKILLAKGWIEDILESYLRRMK